MNWYDLPADYKGMLPVNFHDYIEIKALDGCVSPQLDALFSAVKAAAANRSIAQCNVEGAARWERILGVATPLNSSLQARRDALRARLSSSPPVNLETVRHMVELYMGITVEVRLEKPYVYKLLYRGTSRLSDLSPLYATLYEMIPANLLMQISYFYLTWGELDQQGLTWGQLDGKHLTWGEFERGEWL